MTSSETPTEDADLPEAVAHERETPEQKPAPAPNPDRWIRPAMIAVAVVLGWAFILVTHNIRITAAVVFLWIGWFAVVAGVHYLWQTGTATADAADEEAEWWRPAGEHEELLREKRSLLKAIKEVEFDRQTGKMSEKDAQDLIRGYRARAIEVIKAMDELAAGGERTIRQQIDREIKVRLAIEGQSRKGEAAGERKKKGKGGKHAAGNAAAKKADGKAADKPADKVAADKPADKPAARDDSGDKTDKADKADKAETPAVAETEAKPAVERSEAS